MGFSFRAVADFIMFLQAIEQNLRTEMSKEEGASFWFSCFGRSAADFDAGVCYSPVVRGCG